MTIINFYLKLIYTFMSRWLVVKLEAPKRHLGVVSYLLSSFIDSPLPTWGEGVSFSTYNVFTTVN